MPEILVKPDPYDPRSLLERWGRPSHANDPACPADMRQVAEAAVKIINGGVDLLRNPRAILHNPINKLMANFWRLVGNKVTPTAVASELPFGYKGLFFWCEERAVDASTLSPERLAAIPGFRPGVEIHILKATILIPMDWPQQVKADRWKQMGGLVFVASQANDFWHRKFGQGQSNIIEARAQAWEAEFLNYLAAWSQSGFKPDEYQQHILAKFPQGLASLRAEDRYDLTPFVPQDFARIDRNEEVADVYDAPG